MKDLKAKIARCVYYNQKRDRHICSEGLISQFMFEYPAQDFACKKVAMAIDEMANNGELMWSLAGWLLTRGAHIKYNVLPVPEGSHHRHEL